MERLYEKPKFWTIKPIFEIGRKRKRYLVQSNRVRPLKTEIHAGYLFDLGKGKDNDIKLNSNSEPVEASRIQLAQKAEENICYDSS